MSTNNMTSSALTTRTELDALFSHCKSGSFAVIPLPFASFAVASVRGCIPARRAAAAVVARSVMMSTSTSTTAPPLLPARASPPSAATKRKQFSPLRAKGLEDVGSGDLDAEGKELPRLRGMVFDMDGTLCKPQTYMFTQMRAALAIPRSVDILAHIESLPTAAARADAHSRIRAVERAAMASQTPQPGLRELMTWLASRRVRRAICTRNFEEPVRHLLATFLPPDREDEGRGGGGGDGGGMWPVVTRETAGIEPKPSPEGPLWIVGQWNKASADEGRGADEAPVSAAECIMVGDSIDDLLAGRSAGMATVLLVNKGVNEELMEHECTDIWIEKLEDLIGLLEGGFVGRAAVGPADS